MILWWGVLLKKIFDECIDLALDQAADFLDESLKLIFKSLSSKIQIYWNGFVTQTDTEEDAGSWEGIEEYSAEKKRCDMGNVRFIT